MLCSGGAKSARDTLSGDRDTQILKLPPFVIEAERGRPWKVVTLPAVEVLSRCPDDITLNLINRYERLMRMLSLFLPVTFQTDQDVKTLLVLDDAEYQPKVSRELTDVIEAHVKKGGSDKTVSFMPYFHLWDHDSQVIYFVLEEYESQRGDVSLAPGYLRYLLESRSPALPRWFIEGMVTLQETTIMPVPPVGKRLLAPDSYQYVKPAFPYDEVRFSPLIWVNAQRTEEMMNEVKSAVRTSNRAYLPDSFPFMPLQTMLQTSRLESLNSSQHDLFPFEAALFIRWALDPHPHELSASTEARDRLKSFNGSRIEALWKFVELSSEQPATDQLFKRCFGMSMEDIEARLKGYLPIACLETSDFKLTQNTLPQFHEYKIREATKRDVSIRKGRLDRLALGYVDRFYPELRAPYLEQARRTLNRAYLLGDRTPTLLAEMGLCEVDAGEDAIALPLLQAAVIKQVTRPRVYYELARIEFQRLRSQYSDLSQVKEQVDEISDTLIEGLTQSPPLASTYQLLFEIWLRQGGKLSSANTRYLNKGAILFPRNFRVVYPAALLQIRQGNSTQARQIIRAALDTFEATPYEAKLQQLQQMLKATRPN